MDAVLVSTSNYRHGRSVALERMMASVHAANTGFQGRLRLFLLLQECSVDQFDEFASNCPSFIHVFRCGDRISLSAARNRLLREVFAVPGTASMTSMIAFPDDDCWYPAGTLEQVVKGFAENDLLDFLFCRYSSSPEPFVAGDLRAQRPGASDVVRNASSNTIFLRGSVVLSIGFFDEQLGVGTANGSGEDLDFALAALERSRQCQYLDAALIGHRDKETLYRHRYYRGSLIVLARYALSSSALFYEFSRKLLIGTYLAGTRKLSVGAYFSALGGAITQLGTARSLVK